MICTGYGTGTPSDHNRHSAWNSALAHCPAIISLPNRDRLAIALLTRLSRSPRPSR